MNMLLVVVRLGSDITRSTGSSVHCSSGAPLGNLLTHDDDTARATVVVLVSAALRVAHFTCVVYYDYYVTV
jgi:hypothetical protein